MRQKNRGPTNPADPETWLALVSVFFVYENHLFSKKKKCRQGRKKQSSNCPGQLNFDLGLVKIVALWPSGLVPMVL